MKRKNTMAIAAQDQNENKQNILPGNSKGMSCSTPEPHKASPSPCNSDSDAASPVPFLCTQDGLYGDTEVVWNYYTPNGTNNQHKRTNQDTPLSRKSKRNKLRSKMHRLNDSINHAYAQAKKKLKDDDKKSQLFQDLLEMNKNMQGFLKNTRVETNHDRSGSEEDIFNSSGEKSPKPEGFSRSGSRCLRRNLLSSKYSKPDPEPALESDDSMNECLIRASQMVEEKVYSKRMAEENESFSKQIKIDNCADTISTMKLDSPSVKSRKSCVEDSFDNLVGNMNDSVFEQLTQLPIINESPRHNNTAQRMTNQCITTITHHGNSTGWTIKELIGLESVPSPRSTLARHSSMPEPPAAPSAPPPLAPRAPFSRHSSMPWRPDDVLQSTSNSSGETTPMKCTPEEIKRKRQQAREKLQAKRLFPSNTQSSQSLAEPPTKCAKFQPKFSNPTKNNPADAFVYKNVPKSTANKTDNATANTVSDIKSIIEKKRLEALQKLKMKRSQNH